MRKASDILARLLDENSRGKGQSYASVFRNWRDVAGLSLADHSRVYEIRHHNLFVEVDHNGWMQTLLLRKSRILGTLQRKFPELEIRDIKVRINPSLGAVPDGTAAAAGGTQARGREGGPTGSGPTTPAEGGPPPTAQRAETAPEDPGGEPAQQGEEELESVLAGVRDESLKHRLKKLFLSSLRNRRRP
jgi:hypothetical protein